MSHLDLAPVQHEIHLLEIGFSVGRDLFLRQHGTRLGASARIADHCRVVADDEHDGVSAVLKRSQDVKYDQMTHVQVRSGRIESELYAQPVAAFEACPQVVFHVDLHRPLAQALEELATHGFGLGIDRPWTEVDLRVSRQQRLEQGEDRPVDRIDELDHEERVAH